MTESSLGDAIRMARGLLAEGDRMVLEDDSIAMLLETARGLRPEQMSAGGGGMPPASGIGASGNSGISSAVSRPGGAAGVAAPAIPVIAVAPLQANANAVQGNPGQVILPPAPVLAEGEAMVPVSADASDDSNVEPTVQQQLASLNATLNTGIGMALQEVVTGRTRLCDVTINVPNGSANINITNHAPLASDNNSSIDNRSNAINV